MSRRTREPVTGNADTGQPSWAIPAIRIASSTPVSHVWAGVDCSYHFQRLLDLRKLPRGSKANEGGREDGVDFRRAGGRLIEFGQRQRRAPARSCVCPAAWRWRSGGASPQAVMPGVAGGRCIMGCIPSVSDRREPTRHRPCRKPFCQAASEGGDQFRGLSADEGEARSCSAEICSPCVKATHVAPRLRQARHGWHHVGDNSPTDRPSSR